MLFPDEELIESFIVYEGVHPGIHASYDNFYIEKEPPNGKVEIESIFDGKELDSLMKDATYEFNNMVLIDLIKHDIAIWV